MRASSPGHCWKSPLELAWSPVAQEDDVDSDARRRQRDELLNGKPRGREVCAERRPGRLLEQLGGGSHVHFGEAGVSLQVEEDE